MIRLAEAQQLYDVLSDPLFKGAFQAFLLKQRTGLVSDLVRMVRLNDREVLKEAQIAGRIEVYEVIQQELEKFAAQELKNAA